MTSQQAWLIRVIAKYYERITHERLANLVSLSSDDAEDFLSEMVSSKQLYARIDRPKVTYCCNFFTTLTNPMADQGIISFTKPQTANDTLNGNAYFISSVMSAESFNGLCFYSSLDWSSDIGKLMGLVEDTCHIINKENMINKVKSKFA